MSSWEYLVWLLLALNLALSAGVVLAACVTRRGIEVNHILLFTFGFLFYWILPVAAGSVRLFEEMPGMSLWYGLFDEIAASTLATFLLLGLFYFSSFVVGSALGERVTSRAGGTNKIIYFHRSLLNLYLVPGLVLSALLLYALRNYLFRGYVGIVYEEVTLRGSLISASLFLLVLAILNANNLERVRRVRFREILTNRFFAAYAVVATMILLMGGRLYFVSSIFMLLVYRSVYFERIRYHGFLGLMLVAALASGAVGLLRLGGGIGGTLLLMNIGAESLFTSFSLVGFLREAEFELLNLPVFLLSSFVNLLPTAIFPWKQELILNPADYGYTILAPFGAMNSFVSFMINFGMLGTALALFAFGAFLGMLRASRESTLPKILYIMISGWLAFTFFRDPFSVSLVKVIFQFSILTPVLVIVSLHVLSTIAAVRRRPAEARLPSGAGA